MSDQPEFHFEVTSEEIGAAIDRGDYEWLCAHVFGPGAGAVPRRISHAGHSGVYAVNLRAPACRRL